MPLLLQSDVIRSQECERKYQRLMNKMFAHQIGRNVQVYVDNMLVKSQREDDYLDDLKETFDALHSYNMKLNPSKYAYGVMGRRPFVTVV